MEAVHLTATTTLGWALTNFGPMGTTYTVPDSCPQTVTFLAHTDLPDRGSSDTECSEDTCWFYLGTDEQRAVLRDNVYLAPYFSPGVQCPTGWKSIGAIAHESAGQPLASNGIFTITPGYESFPGEGTWLPYYPTMYDALGAILEVGETAVACCPSTMTLGPSGGCYSELPSPTNPISTGCAPEYGGQVLGTTTTTYVIGGTTTSGEFYFPESPIAQLGTLVTETLSADELSEYNLITIQVPVYFVRPSGVEEVEAGATSGSGSGSGSEEAAETGTDNAAVAVGYAGGRGSSWAQIGSIGGVLAMSVLAGMAMVLPW